MILKKRGLAYLYVVFIALVIFNLIVVVQMFQDQQAFIVDYESEAYITYLVAEAGLNAAVHEINTNFEWGTHDTAEVQADGTFNFTTPRSDISNYIEGNDRFEINEPGTGEYTGKMKIMDSDNFDAEFKVKSARIRSGDNPLTTTVDESNIFNMVQVVSKFNDTYRKIEAIIQIAYANKYILYDGKYQLLAFGVGSGSQEEIVLADGEIYGKEQVLLGTQKNSAGSEGPPLHLSNNPSISTGTNGLIAMAPSDKERVSVTRNTLNGVAIGSDYTKINTKIKEVESDSAADEEQEQEILKGENKFGNLFKDRYTGGRDYDIDYEGLKNYYKALALGNMEGQGTGIYIEESNSDIYWQHYPIPYEARYKTLGGPDDSEFQVMKVDFGEMVMEAALNLSNSDDFGPSDDNKLPFSPPGDFNGVIYSEVPLVIWGNPDRDMMIYSEKDIFIAGDFNQRQVTGTMTVAGENPEPVKQNYQSKSLLEYEEMEDYITGNENWRTMNPGHGAYWQNIDIISETRVWIDYTDPRKFSRNEIIPFIHYEIYRELYREFEDDGEGNYNILEVDDNTREAAHEFSVLSPEDPSDMDIDMFDAQISGGVDQTVLFRLFDLIDTGSDADEILTKEYFSDPSYEGSVANYLVNTLFVPEDTAEVILQEMSSMIENGLLEHEVMRELIQEKIWGEKGPLPIGFIRKFKPSDWGGDGSEEQDGIVQRLYDKVRVGGMFGQSFTTGDNFAEDEFYIPEMTVNAKRISMGDLVPNHYEGGTPVIPANEDNSTHRWDVRVDLIEEIESSADYDALETIRRVAVIREEIGNYRHTKPEGDITDLAPGKTWGYVDGDVILQRIYGSELYLRNMPDLSRLPYLSGGVYSPHARKKIFNPFNRTPFEVRGFNMLDMKYHNIKEEDFDNF
ncbi:MAG: hypothetical protein ACQESP_03560 [Candidatus Muiribacteriota bacterium]